MAVDEGRAVVETIGVGNDLPVRPLFGHLLEVAVQIADFRLRVLDGLAVEQDLHSEGAVHGRMRRAHVQDQMLGTLGHVEEPLFRLPVDVPFPGREVLAHRMSHEIVVSQDADQIRMTEEGDAVEIEGLALEPVGALVDVGERIAGGALLGKRGLEADMVLLRDRVEVEDHLETKRSRLVVEVVDAAQIEEELVIEFGMIAQGAGRFLPGRTVDGDREVAPVFGDPENLLAKLLGEDPIRGLGERLVALQGGHARHGANRSRARRALR